MEKKKNRKVKKIKRKEVQSSILLLLCAVLFCVYAVTLVIERSSINALDTQIRELQEEYSQIVSINDDLQGRILESGSLNDIESYAVNVLGMIKPQNSYITYVAYASENTQTAEGNASGEVTFLSRLGDLFR